MGRKKENFDPLAGPISGSSDGSRKKKSKGKTFDVLGGGHKTEKTPTYDDFYSPDAFNSSGSADTRDALTPDGTKPAKKEKPKKKGFLASLFGGGKKTGKKPAADPAPEPVPESREGYEPIQNTETPLAADERNPEEDLFEEEISAIQTPASETPEPVAVQKNPEQLPANVCWLCGETSESAHPYFTLHPGSQESGNAVPLCKTCYRAVTTLMKYRDPSDEQEIKTEWKTLCTTLNETRVTRVITEGRKYH